MEGFFESREEFGPARPPLRIQCVWFSRRVGLHHLSTSSTCESTILSLFVQDRCLDSKVPFDAGHRGQVCSRQRPVRSRAFLKARKSGGCVLNAGGVLGQIWVSVQTKKCHTAPQWRLFCMSSGFCASVEAFLSLGGVTCAVCPTVCGVWCLRRGLPSLGGRRSEPQTDNWAKKVFKRHLARTHLRGPDRLITPQGNTTQRLRETCL